MSWLGFLKGLFEMNLNLLPNWNIVLFGIYRPTNNFYNLDKSDVLAMAQEQNRALTPPEDKKQPADKESIGCDAGETTTNKEN